jgi:hypothetical protein
MHIALLFCVVAWAILAPAIFVAWTVSPFLALAFVVAPIAILLDLLARSPRRK